MDVNGVTLLAGQKEMGKPLGTNRVRQLTVKLLRFKSPPVITATVCANDSPGNMFYFFQILYTDRGTYSEVKFSAQTLQTGGDTFHYVCHFNVVGELE